VAPLVRPADPELLAKPLPWKRRFFALPISVGRV
jgi:hypothetical protein